jgi:predicted PolB exonuclease-like 3'-5' exonuclease
MTEQKNEIILLSDIKDKTTVSARVNSYVVDMYKESEIPISMVIESGLVHFMKLDDEEKIKFISQNLIDNVKVKELKKPKNSWKNMLEKNLKDFSIPVTLISSLIAGVGVAAVATIGGFLTTLDKKKLTDEE